ncbi:hypothetical protein Tco_0313480 [Tanacetum coccineum]
MKSVDTSIFDTLVACCLFRSALTSHVTSVCILLGGAACVVDVDIPPSTRGIFSIPWPRMGPARIAEIPGLADNAIVMAMSLESTVRTVSPRIVSSSMYSGGCRDPRHLSHGSAPPLTLAVVKVGRDGTSLRKFLTDFFA